MVKESKLTGIAKQKNKEERTATEPKAAAASSRVSLAQDGALRPLLSASHPMVMPPWHSTSTALPFEIEKLGHPTLPEAAGGESCYILRLR